MDRRAGRQARPGKFPATDDTRAAEKQLVGANVDHVARLERENRMHDARPGRGPRRAGRRPMERAYAGPATADVPADLADAIAADPRAQAMFEVLTAANRYALIYRTNASDLRTPGLARSRSSWRCSRDMRRRIHTSGSRDE